MGCPTVSVRLSRITCTRTALVKSITSESRSRKNKLVFRKKVSGENRQWNWGSYSSGENEDNILPNPWDVCWKRSKTFFPPTPTPQPSRKHKCVRAHPRTAEDIVRRIRHSHVSGDTKLGGINGVTFISTPPLSGTVFWWCWQTLRVCRAWTEQSCVSLQGCPWESRHFYILKKGACLIQELCAERSV